jgi:hypothetical protein
VIQNDHENQNDLLDQGGQAVQVTPIFREIQTVQAAQEVLVVLAIQNVRVIPIFRVIQIFPEAP